MLDLVKRLGEQGLAVIIISHNLHDIFEVADSITVLRLGQNVAEFKRRETTQADVVQAITAASQLRTCPASPRSDRVSTDVTPVETSDATPVPAEGIPGETLSHYFRRWWVGVRSGDLGRCRSSPG